MSIFYQNNSKLVTPAEFQKIITAVNWQLTHEFASEYGLQPFPFTLTIEDELGPNDPSSALGYHDIVNFKPFAKVFAGPAQRANVPLSVVVSHEAMELLVDPFGINVCIIDTSGGAGISGFIVWNEICDAPETFSYKGEGGVLVSDFVLRGWYIPGYTGHVDFMHIIPEPLVIANGGYASVDQFQGSGVQSISAFLNRLAQKRKVHYL